MTTKNIIFVGIYEDNESRKKNLTRHWKIDGEKKIKWEDSTNRHAELSLSKDEKWHKNPSKLKEWLKEMINYIQIDQMILLKKEWIISVANYDKIKNELK